MYGQYHHRVYTVGPMYVPERAEGQGGDNEIGMRGVAIRYTVLKTTHLPEIQNMYADKTHSTWMMSECKRKCVFVTAENVPPFLSA